jgi:hypothetical protein
MLGESARKSMESDPEDFSDETNTETLYGTSPPSTPRQMKRLSAKHQRNSAGRPASRSNLKGEPVTCKIHGTGRDTFMRQAFDSISDSFVLNCISVLAVGLLF